MPPSKPESRRRARIACKPCRQAKVRCGAEQIPCTRCEKLRLSCTVDPQYKRHNKHDRVNELESNLRELQSVVVQQRQQQQQGDHQQPPQLPQALQSQPAALPQPQLQPQLLSQQQTPYDTVFGFRHASPSTQATGSIDTPADAFSSYPRPREASEKPAWRHPSLTSSLTSPHGHTDGSYLLGDVKLGFDQAETLFTRFFEKYHTFLPILEPATRAMSCHASSTLLFWVIVSIAARQNVPDSDLLTRLMRPLHEFVWKEVSTNSNHLTNIQAFLLLAAWPLPNIRLWSDKSLVLSSIALTSAMHLGLHRPGFEREYSRTQIVINDRIVQERTRAWVACVILSESLALDFGQPSIIPKTDKILDKICEGKSALVVPEALRHHLLIQRCGHNVNQSLSAFIEDEDPAHLVFDPFASTVSRLERDIDGLASAHEANMSLMNKLRLLGLKLSLQSMYFLCDSSHTSHKAGVLKAVSTASVLLDTLISDDASNELLAYSSLATLQIILRAALVILKVLNSSYGADMDRGHAHFLINAAAFSIRQMSVQPKDRDQPIRVAGSIRAMWRIFENDTEKRRRPPMLMVRSRLGASLLYDCLIVYRDHATQEGQSANQTSTSDNPQEDAPSQLNMPSAPKETSQELFVGASSLAPPAIPSQLFPDDSDFLTNSQLLDVSDFSWMEGLGYPSLFSAMS